MILKVTCKISSTDCFVYGLIFTHVFWSLKTSPQYFSDKPDPDSKGCIVTISFTQRGPKKEVHLGPWKTQGWPCTPQVLKAYYICRNFLDHPEYGHAMSDIIMQNILVDRYESYTLRLAPRLLTPWVTPSTLETLCFVFYAAITLVLLYSFGIWITNMDIWIGIQSSENIIISFSLWNTLHSTLLLMKI